MSAELRAQLQLLPDYLGSHMLISLAALGAGVLISLPLAILLLRSRRLQAPIMALVSALQTIPGLALLALMVPLLGRIGFLPAFLALTLYSVLPVMRNTVTGISTVDPALVEAGQGLGMTASQLLWRVQLPLAIPVIVAGIRTSAVWVVGMATLSTPVGATSLGNYIFSGLQTQNYTAVLVGCVSAGGLALLLDGLIRLIETGLSARRRVRLAVASTALLALFVAGLAPALPWFHAQDRTIVIGAKTFTEQYVLARLLADQLEAAGFATRTVDSLGSRVAFDALISGQIDLYVEYSGTIWANYMKRDDNPGRVAIEAGVRDWLRERYGIGNPVPLGFENSYVLAIRRTDAERFSLRTIADLLPRAAVAELEGRIDAPRMRAANRAVDLEGRSVASAAAALRREAAGLP